MGKLNDTKRIEALESLDILDTLPEQAYDNITKLASYICQTPIALVSLVSNTRQFFKSNHGLEDRETPIDISFCKYVVEDEEPLVVKDAREDERFKDNPLVTGTPNIVFYTGFPLITESGFALGSLCVLDRQPRELDEQQLIALKALASQVEQLLALRSSHLLLAQNEKKMAEEATRINNIIEGTRVGTWEWYIQTGKVVVNNRWAQMVGYTPEEFGLKDGFIDIGAWYKIIHPDDVAFSDTKLKECFEQKSEYFDIECRLVHKDGSIVWINDRGKMVSWAETGEPLIMSGTHTDITKRKNAEQQFKAITDNLPGILCRFKLFTDGSDTFEYVSGGAQDFWGFSAEEVMADSKLVWHRCHPDDIAGLLLSIKKSATELSEWEHEYRYMHPNGSILWFKGKGKPSLQYDGTIIGDAVILDVTEEIHVKLALKETEKKFIHLFDDVTSLSVQGYSSDGTVVFWNKASEILYGYTHEEALGKKLWDLIIPAAMVDEVKENLAQMIAREEGIAAHKLNLKRKEGSLVPVFSNHSVITIPGRTPELLCIDIDLSPQKQAEAQVRYSVALMAEAQKLAKIGS